MKYYKYKIYCETDAKFEYIIKEETEAAPTTCPVDTNHVCTANSVAIHETIDNSIQQVDIQSQPAFAVPEFRTKWDASPDVVTAEASQTVIMDYFLPEERYVHGGSIVFDGVHLGDKLEAYLIDSNGVIPEAYRAAVAEAYPVIAKYIINNYLPSGSGVRELNTYPLNAKITQGLNLRVVINTCATPGTRKFATNYLLTKKL